MRLLSLSVGLIALLAGFSAVAAASGGQPNTQFGPCDNARPASATRATIRVPLRAATPSAGSINIALVRIPSTGAKPGSPVFWLNGGPGQSNLDFKPPAWLLANHDVVLVGYRGIDGPVRLDCPEVGEALVHTGGDLLGRSGLRGIGKALDACHARLAQAGTDVRDFTVDAVAQDLETVRVALGYGRINLYSGSYGTRVALHYATRFPDSVERSVLIGANPSGNFIWEPAYSDRVLAQYSKLCAADAHCRARSGDLAASIKSVNRAMPRSWLGYPIDPGKVKVVSFALLFNRATAAQVFDAYLAAEDGDPSGLAAMSFASDWILPGLQVWGDFFAKGSIDHDAGRNYRLDLDPPDSPLGSPLGLMAWGGIQEAKHWPVPARPEMVSPGGEIPTLIVSGNLDFSTPAETARDQLLPGRNAYHQVIVSDAGHVPDIMSLQPDAYARLVGGFLRDGSVDQSGFRHQAMVFQVQWGLPLLAKIGVAVLIALLLLGVLLLWIIARAISRNLLPQR